MVPLYTEEDARPALDALRAGPLRRGVSSPLPGVTARFLDAGHILGSAQALLEIEEDGRRRRLLFSGDLGRKGLPILKDPAPPGRRAGLRASSRAPTATACHDAIASAEEDLAERGQGHGRAQAASSSSPPSPWAAPRRSSTP